MGDSRGPARRCELPRTLPTACASLVTCLRALKDRSHLNLAELAAATAISKSSWERYLNGKQFPPRYAVEALCRAAHEPVDAPLAQWQLADAAWSRRGHTAPPGPEHRPPSGAGTGPVPTAGQPSPRRAGLPRGALRVASVLITRRPKATAAGVALLCAAMITSAAVVHASRTAPASAPRPPICRLRSCEGRNPRTTACEDPTTVASHTAADGTRLEIRRSAACQAGWIRARPTHPGFRIRLTSPGTPSGQALGTTWSADLEPVNTTMIAAPRASRLRACYYPTADRPDRECFGGGDVPSP